MPLPLDVLENPLPSHLTSSNLNVILSSAYAEARAPEIVTCLGLAVDASAGSLRRHRILLSKFSYSVSLPGGPHHKIFPGPLGGDSILTVIKLIGFSWYDGHIDLKSSNATTRRECISRERG